MFLRLELYDTDANVCAKLKARSEVGQRKYGCSTERTDLALIDWLRHAQEEAMDHAVYLEAAIRAIERAGGGE